MVTCPWCGTNYKAFQSNCDNCGGSLPLTVESTAVPVETAFEQERTLIPPLPPRTIPKKIMSRMLMTDAAGITGGIFILIGGIFFVVGISLIFPVVTALVGAIFIGLGFVFLLLGGILFAAAYQNASQTIEILRNGQAVLGDITGAHQNLMVRVNGRYSWEIMYRFKVHGQSYYGKVNTLGRPDLSQQPGKAVYVLYQQGDPNKNTLYPSPYGYYGL